MANHKVKVHVKSMPYSPRDKAGEYRAGSVQILDAHEAYELDAAGIVMIVEDPYAEPAERPIPYVEESDSGSGEGEDPAGGSELPDSEMYFPEEYANGKEDVGD